jgi:hypothetical protein
VNVNINWGGVLAWLAGPAAVAVTATLAWLYRRRLQEAETTEITDRIARTWIVDLEKKVERLERKLDKEIRNRRALTVYADAVEDWIADGKHAPPPARPVLEF